MVSEDGNKTACTTKGNLITQILMVKHAMQILMDEFSKLPAQDPEATDLLKKFLGTKAIKSDDEETH